MIIFSPGLRCFKRFDRLREVSGLSIDCIFLHNGGFLDISHVTYRKWMLTIKALEKEAKAKKNLTIICDVNPNAKTLQAIDLGISLLEEVLEKQFLPMKEKSNPKDDHKYKLTIVRYLRDKALQMRGQTLVIDKHDVVI